MAHEYFRKVENLISEGVPNKSGGLENFLK